MKIGFFSERYLPQIDGVVYSIVNFRKELEALGHEVFIFAPAPSFRYKETDPHIIRFPAIKGLGFDDYLTKFPWTPQAYRRAHRLGLDIVHIHTPSEMGIFGIAVALKDNIPLVTTYHTDLFEYVKHYPQALPGAIILSQMLPLLVNKPNLYKTSITLMRPEISIDRWSQKLVTKMIPLMNNLCDLVIAPSFKVAEQLKSWKTIKPVAILPTGVDKITTNSDEIKSFYNKYSSLRGKKVILNVGRPAAEKNLELLIRAFAIVHKHVPDSRVVIVGDNVHRKVLQAMAKSLGLTDKVIFTGFITDRTVLGAVFESSYVFAFPSRTDTQGLVVNEAAAAGVPTVMIDHGITEVVIDNKSGLYAKNNAADFADKLISILKDQALHDRLGDDARTRASKLSVNSQAKRLEALYKDLLNKPVQTKS